jgi:hypothetical protein
MHVLPVGLRTYCVAVLQTCAIIHAFPFLQSLNPAGLQGVLLTPRKTFPLQH